MYGDIEQLVLSGALFNGSSRSSSPVRSPSPGNEKVADWPPKSEAKFGDGYDYDEYDSDAERLAQIPKQETDGAGPIGMKPGRTGVKGVIRDRNEAKDLQRAQRAQDVRELNKRMEKANLGGKTFSEEEREREWERMMLEGLDLAPPGTADAKRLDPWRGRKKMFGHLREVGVRGFVAAVEEEAKGVWVVVHLYDPSLDRCFDLDTTLSRLARLNPDTKFVRTRAGALGFASVQRPRTLPSRATLSSTRQSKSSGIRHAIIDEDDPYDYAADEREDEDGEDDEDGYSRGDEEDVDLDMLPTMLVYRDGELVHNWVRVDWEAGQTRIEELLSKHHILQGARGNCGLPSDDDDDLFDDGDDLEFESGV